MLFQVPPHFSPMLLVPCGHTLCKHCSKRTKYCGMCGSAVESHTPNAMLEQIITNYNSNQNKYPAEEQSGLLIWTPSSLYYIIPSFKDPEEEAF